MSSLRPDTGVIQKAVFKLGLVESFLGISGPLLAVSFVLILVLWVYNFCWALFAVQAIIICRLYDISQLFIFNVRAGLRHFSTEEKLHLIKHLNVLPYEWVNRTSSFLLFNILQTRTKCDLSLNNIIHRNLIAEDDFKSCLYQKRLRNRFPPRWSGTLRQEKIWWKNKDTSTIVAFKTATSSLDNTFMTLNS